MDYNSGRLPLHFYVRCGRSKQVKTLIRHVNINEADSGGSSALHVAAEHGFYDIAKLLVENGANVNLMNSNGNTALDIAIKKQDRCIIRLLVEKNAVINVSNLDTKAFFLSCLQNGNDDVARLFIKKQSSEIGVTDRVFTPLQDAYLERNWNNMEMLLSNGADPTPVLEFHHRSYFSFVKLCLVEDKLRIVNLLFEKKHKVYRDLDFAKLLCLCIVTRKKHIVRLLLLGFLKYDNDFNSILGMFSNTEEQTFAKYLLQNHYMMSRKLFWTTVAFIVKNRNIIHRNAAFFMVLRTCADYHIKYAELLLDKSDLDWENESLMALVASCLYRAEMPFAKYILTRTDLNLKSNECYFLLTDCVSLDNIPSATELLKRDELQLITLNWSSFLNQSMLKYPLSLMKNSVKKCIKYIILQVNEPVKPDFISAHSLSSFWDECEKEVSDLRTSPVLDRSTSLLCFLRMTSDNELVDLLRGVNSDYKVPSHDCFKSMKKNFPIYYCNIIFRFQRGWSKLNWLQFANMLMPQCDLPCRLPPEIWEKIMNNLTTNDIANLIFA